VERETKKGLRGKSGVRLVGVDRVGSAVDPGTVDPHLIPDPGLESQPTKTNGGRASPDDKWAWAKDDPDEPAITWPLGELVMGRHDMQHTRIFNS